MTFPWMLSLFAGLLSLSQEILWVRVMGFALGGAPLAFAYVLSLYLIGIAAGAAIGKRLCASRTDLYRVAAITLLLAAVTDPLPPLLGSSLALHGGSMSVSHVALPTVLILLTAAIKSVLFPIVHHLGASRVAGNVGSSVSNVYFGNIVGSTLGPWITGFFLLDRFSVDSCFQLVAVASLVLAGMCAYKAGGGRVLSGLVAAVCVLLFGTWALLPQSQFVIESGERWVDWKANHVAEFGVVRHVIENKHGVIHTIAQEGRQDDVIYGGNIYDGRVSYDLRLNSNGIDRVYMLAAFHPRPERVLVVGLSGGGWVRALMTIPSIKSIDVVEINRGYLDLVNRYEAVRPVLTDPRIHIAIDDGRRWLKRYGGPPFDLIVMNTTFHWRAYATNILSQEFMRELERHLSRGGVLAFNTTQALDAFKTAGTVFEQVHRYQGFAYAARHDFRPTREAAQERLLQLNDNGTQLLQHSDFKGAGIGLRLAAPTMEPLASLLARHHDTVGIITDANMLTEYRDGKRTGVAALDALLPKRNNPLIKEIAAR